jgi:hypothetical protein
VNVFVWEHRLMNLHLPWNQSSQVCFFRSFWISNSRAFRRQVHTIKNPLVLTKKFIAGTNKNSIPKPACKNFCHGENDPPVASLGTAVRAVAAVEIQKSR